MPLRGLRICLSGRSPSRKLRGASRDDFAILEFDRDRAVGTAPSLADLVHPHLRVVGDGVYSCDGDLVARGRARVDEVLAEVVDLTDSVFLLDAESPGRQP